MQRRRHRSKPVRYRSFPSFWRPAFVLPNAGRTYSYGILAAATGTSALWPHETAAVLGPLLLVGLVSLGVAHGACDQLVLPAYRPGRRRGWPYLLRFASGYLGLAAAVGLVWWRWPGVGVGLFFGFTVWHWGSADAPAHQRPGVWVVHSILRGALLLAVPTWWWPVETVDHVNGLLQLMGSTPLATPSWSSLLPAVVAGHLGLWGYFAYHQEFSRSYRDAGEVGLLTGLLMALPPLQALGIYFVFWHSWQHILRLAPVLGGMASQPGAAGWALLRQVVVFGRRAFPMLAITLVAGILAYVLAGAWLPANAPWLSLAVVGASVVTLPHALLVSVIMDAPKWQRRYICH
jgi:Brp/Blh family beta-carotene 15,15'-monooxygenase